jgi:hypothetical protein
MRLEDGIVYWDQSTVHKQNTEDTAKEIESATRRCGGRG